MPWCFPVRQPLVEACPAATTEAARATAAVAGKSSQPLPVVAGNCSQNLHFLLVSEVTLGYVRYFFGAILNLLRPSVPWCFPVRQPLVEPCRAATAEAAGATAAVAGKSSQPLPVLARKCSQNLPFCTTVGNRSCQTIVEK